MFHALLIDLWPSLSAFADDLAIPYETAKAMRRRGSIPAGYWKRMVESAADREICGVTLERLADLAAEAREAV